MKTVCEINTCNGCMGCVDRCPKQCISVKDDMQTVNALIDEEKCINCGLCKGVCPNITKPELKEPIIWKQGWAYDDVRKDSTSGGVAALLIKSFLESGGYVASCLFQQGDFLFEITNDVAIAKRFIGSKYVKSNPQHIYKKIAKRLETDMVLFIGLPCQVAALKNYVKNQEHLYTVDLICHGTPSIKMLDLFLKEKDVDIHSLRDIKFRTKTDMGLINDGKKLTPDRVIDDYLCTFLESINYTQNCYSCQFATLKRVSDITIGDSWGTEYREEEKRGVSLILVQSDKGKELLSGCEMELKTVDLNKAIENNHQLSHPSILSSKRKMFFHMLETGKSFRWATFCVLPKLVIKQRIKYLLSRLHLMKYSGGGYKIVVFPKN